MLMSCVLPSMSAVVWSSRHFRLHLTPDTSDLTRNAEIRIISPKDAKTKSEYNPNSFLTGYVEDDHHSSIAAFSDKGVMSASIHCSEGSYYLKPARDHFKEPQKFHSIIYRGVDISPWPVSMLRNQTLRAQLDNSTLCGVSSAHEEPEPHQDIMVKEIVRREKRASRNTESSRQKRVTP